MSIKGTAYYLELLANIQSRNDFQALSILDMEATVAYGYMNTLYGSLEAQREKFIDQYAKTATEKTTNASLERAWNITKKGQQMILLKRDIQSMEAILRSIKNKLIVLSIEYKETRQ